MLFKAQRKQLQQQNLHIAISKIQPDCIHIQWPSVIPWFEEILTKQKIPVVLSQRGYHSNVRPFVNSENFEYLKQWYPKIAGFHSVSKAISQKGDLIYNSPIKIDKVVYTGIDLKEIPFLETFQKEKELNIISIGRAHWIKGYNYALQTCKILKEKGISFKYTIVGGLGDEELLYLRKSYNLENEIVFLDKVPEHEVIKLMQEVQLMLLPSIEEGIANVVVEAMAVGLPVISTNCGGMEELISHTKEGWLVPTRDPEAIAQAVMNFKELSQEQIDSNRKNARAKIEQQFTVDAMVKGMEELYYEVID
jgi:colanic acid/amylovoran biosynthesis glycosyltransferase